MKRGIVFMAIAGALVGAFALGRAGAQEGTEGAGGPDEITAWLELAKTGPEHVELLKTVGAWECEGKCWMEPGAEPIVARGKAVFTAVLGDRFVRQDYAGEITGQTFEAISFTGFNRATRKWEMFCMDSMGTGTMLMTGTETAKGVHAFTGSFSGPGGVEVKSRYVVRRISDDKLVAVMFNDWGMGEMKCMEVTYTRSK